MSIGAEEGQCLGSKGQESGFCLSDFALTTALAELVSAIETLQNYTNTSMGKTVIYRDKSEKKKKVLQTLGTTGIEALFDS